MDRKAVLLLCGCLSLPLNPVSAAQAAVRARSSVARTAFDIPAQPLAAALVAFSKQSNVQVLMAGDTVASLRSTAIIGQLTDDAALAALLQTTHLSYAFIDPGTVVVRPEPSASSRGGKPADPVEAAHVKLLAPVEAVGLSRSGGFLFGVTSTATHGNQSLIDIPESISIVTRELMDSQQIRTVAGAVRNVAGVQYLDGTYGFPMFQIRGFKTGHGMTDGMFNSIDGSGDYPPLIGVERVEVLKGPENITGDSSANNDFGGLINVVLKKPQSKPVHELSYTLGSYAAAQVGLDLAGTVGNSTAFTYRLVLSGEYADHTAQGYRGERDRYVAPSVTWQHRDTKLTVGAQRSVNRVPTFDHTILLGEGVGSGLPFGTLAGNAGDHSTFQTSRFYYLFEQQLGNDWMLRSLGHYVHQQTSQQFWTLKNPRSNGDVDAIAAAYHYADAYYALQNDATATFYQGMLTHNVTLGFDYSRSRFGNVDLSFNSLEGTPYNIFSSLGLPSVRSVLGPDSSYYQPGNAWSTHSGLLLQDQISFGERWELLLALRRSAYELSTYDKDSNLQILQKAQWVPNAGLVYKLTPDVALYSSASIGFRAETERGQNGRLLSPAMARQIEAGIKFNLFENRARLTAAWYRIMLDSSVDVFSGELPYFAIPGPGQTNRGLEIEFTGRVAPGLNVLSSYTSARVLNHDGTPVTGSSRHRVNLWLSYRVQNGVFQGWGAAAGVFARSHSQGQLTPGGTYFAIPGNARVDANVSYQTPRWEMTLGIRNLLGRRLYNYNFDNSFVPLQERRSVLLTGTYQI